MSVEVTILFIGLLTLVASLMGTMTGFGTSTIMIPVLLWKMIMFRRGATGRLLLSFGLPSIIAAYAGARLTLTADPTVLLRVLGASFVAYTTFLLFHSGWKLPGTAATAVAGGLASGLMAGIFGVSGAVRGGVPLGNWILGVGSFFPIP